MERQSWNKNVLRNWNNTNSVLVSVCGVHQFMQSFFLSLQTEGGKISIEGSVCDDYYSIRKLLYEQFAIV